MRQTASGSSLKGFLFGSRRLVGLPTHRLVLSLATPCEPCPITISCRGAEPRAATTQQLEKERGRGLYHPSAVTPFQPSASIPSPLSTDHTLFLLRLPLSPHFSLDPFASSLSDTHYLDLLLYPCLDPLFLEIKSNQDMTSPLSISFAS